MSACLQQFQRGALAYRLCRKPGVSRLLVAANVNDARQQAAGRLAPWPADGPSAAEAQQDQPRAALASEDGRLPRETALEAIGMIAVLIGLGTMAALEVFALQAGLGGLSAGFLQAVGPAF